MVNLEKNKPTRTCAKILKVRTYSLLLFSKRNPVAKSLSCLELVKWLSPTGKSCRVLVYSALL
jgi:hypothetical protein